MTRILGFVVAVLLGIAAGLAIGWLALPALSASGASSAPESLRIDYKSDYVLMVAEAYHSDKDLNLAAGRLAVLGDPSPETIANQAVIWANQAGYATDDLRRMADLATALRSWSPPAQGQSPTQPGQAVQP
jgi:hypothetical protein